MIVGRPRVSFPGSTAGVRTTWRSSCARTPTRCSGNASGGRDYDLFASDQLSKPFVKEVTGKLARYGKKSGLRNSELPYFIVAFVQHLPYTVDDVTTGFDEYPRFPYETLYDNGGDCEDTSILVSAMLHELRYEVALLHFPGHMAVGVGVPSGCRSAPLPAPGNALLLPGDDRRRLGRRSRAAEHSRGSGQGRTDHRTTGDVGRVHRRIPAAGGHRCGRRAGGGDESWIQDGARRHRVRGAAQGRHRPDLGSPRERPVPPGPGTKPHSTKSPACALRRARRSRSTWRRGGRNFPVGGSNQPGAALTVGRLGLVRSGNRAMMAAYLDNFGEMLVNARRIS